MFERKGEIVIGKADAPDEDELFMIVADAGGEDLELGEDEVLVYTTPGELISVKNALAEAGLAVKGAELAMEPVNATVVSASDAKKVFRLVDRLEESDDIQNVYHTMELTDEILAALD
jgi:transcriptional/translational regulatory protein YebC/TACO1